VAAEDAKEPGLEDSAKANNSDSAEAAMDSAAPGVTPTRALVIGRRRRGRRIGTAIRDTKQQLESAGWTVETRFVDRKKQLRRQAKKAVSAGVDVVVAVGGDGAVLQVVQSIGETEVALGIVPMGTGNLVATNLGLPKELDAAVDVMTAGARRRIDLGRVKIGGKTKLFAVACGIGFDAEVMRGTTKKAKNRLGKLAYAASVVRKRGSVRNVDHEVEVDGHHLKTPAMQVLVANFGQTGLGLEPKLPIEPDDGILDVMVLQASGPISGLAAAWEAIRQRRRGRSSGGRVYRTHGREVLVDASTKRLVEIDGSVIGETPVEISIRPSALTVLVPARKK
jgi:YegS/Rv2252/BmrU family lipid kinase